MIIKLNKIILIHNKKIKMPIGVMRIVQFKLSPMFKTLIGGILKVHELKLYNWLHSTNFFLVKKYI